MNRYKKKAGAASLKYDFFVLNKGVTLIFSGLFLLVAMFVRWCCGSPIQLVHSLALPKFLPPIFLIVLLFTVFYLLLGAALSSGLFSCANANPEERYKGGMYFFIMLFLSYSWYPIFFCANLMFISLLVSILCLFAGIVSNICFAKVSHLSAIALALCNIYLAYLTFLNIRVFFSI